MSTHAHNPHPDTLDIEAQIRDAYRQPEPEPERAAGRLDRLGPIVPLADLRAALPDVPRDTFDTALARLADHSDVHVIPSGRIAHRDMADADRDAGLWLGGQHNHTIHIDDTRTTDGIVARLHMRDRDQAASMVAALDDAEVESVARAMGVDIFHGAPALTCQRRQWRQQFTASVIAAGRALRADEITTRQGPGEPDIVVGRPGDRPYEVRLWWD
jgi:hypothetical protein